MTKRVLPGSTPPAPKPKPRTPRSPRPRSKERLWLACFQFDESAPPGIHCSHGRFIVAVRTTTARKALDLCRARLRHLRSTTRLFDSPCTIFLDHVIAIPDTSTTPALVNYSRTVYFDRGGEGEILSGVPEQEDLDGELQTFGPAEEKDKPLEAFLDFGGQRANDALPAAMRVRDSSEDARPVQHPSGGRPKRR